MTTQPGVVIDGPKYDNEIMETFESNNNNNNNKKECENRVDEFERDGYLVIRDLLSDPTVLQEWQDFSQGLVEYVMQQLYVGGYTPFPQEWRLGGCNNDMKEYAMGRGVKHGFREIVMRSPGRYEIALVQNNNTLWNPNNNITTNTTTTTVTTTVTTTTTAAQQQDKEQSPPENPLESPRSPPCFKKLYDILEQRGIPSLLSQTSWDDIHVSSVSLIASTPGSSMQGWHADGGHLNVTRHLPCHCLNVFISLMVQDMTLELGPTQLRPGTHVHTRNLPTLLLAAACRKSLPSPQTPLLKRGDALIFDYRILHRGLPNITTSETRYMLAITIAQKWFRDKLNFPSRSLFPQKKQEEETSMEGENVLE